MRIVVASSFQASVLMFFHQNSAGRGAAPSAGLPGNVLRARAQTESRRRRRARGRQHRHRGPGHQRPRRRASEDRRARRGGDPRDRRRRRDRSRRRRRRRSASMRSCPASAAAAPRRWPTVSPQVRRGNRRECRDILRRDHEPGGAGGTPAHLRAARQLRRRRAGARPCAGARGGRGACARRNPGGHRADRHRRRRSCSPISVSTIARPDAPPAC